MGLGSFCLIAVLSLGPEVEKLYYTLEDMLGSMSRVSNSDLGWVVRICISNNFPGDADAVGLRTTLRATVLGCGSCPFGCGWPACTLSVFQH